MTTTMTGRLKAFLARWRTRGEVLAEVRTWKPPEFFLRTAQRINDWVRKRRGSAKPRPNTVAAGVTNTAARLLSSLRRNHKDGRLLEQDRCYRWQPADTGVDTNAVVKYDPIMGGKGDV